MADAARYHRIQRRLAILGFVLSTAYLLALLFTPDGRAFARWLSDAAESHWAQVALVTVALVGIHAILTAPFGVIRGYGLPKRFGLIHQPFGGWLMDRVKAALIGGVLGLAAIEMVYALLALTSFWWLWSAAALLVAQVALTAVLPIWIAPLFYRLTPLADERLGERLLALARRAGVETIGVFVADQSRKSRTANAAVVGLGRTRRIVLFDTLLANFPPEEIESVLAHELAHHVHGDVRRGLILSGAVSVVTFWLASLALDAGVPLLDLEGRADPAGLPWLALVLAALALVQLPLGNGFSRWLERRADDFAVATTRDAPAFIAAMERLGRLNLAEPTPSRFREIVFYSHPPLERRIARARASLA